MAIYYLGMKTFGRAGGKAGSRATSGAAYRAGERIRDDRTGAVYDHSGRRDVLHKEIVLPRELATAGARLDWARNRSVLWNAAERAEKRRNARVAREFTLGLPHELPPGARARLTLRFAQEIADRYHNAVDVAIHAPRGDPRNFHAHLLTTTREVTSEGLGRKTALELSGTERYRRGLARWADEVTAIRERWAVVANEALNEAGIEARVAYRGRGEPNAARSATPRLPLAAYHIERRGGRSFIAERIREKHRAELERQALVERAARSWKVADKAAEPDTLAREAARKWRAYREMQVARAAGHAIPEPRTLSREPPTRAAAKGRGLDDDFGL
ncbi:MAG: MobA/MobL family protein [Steroidobacteraceae bacterium]